MDVCLGRPIYTNDGQRIGMVNRLVIDPGTKDWVEIISHRGLILADDRVVERQFVARVDEDGGVHLTIPSSALNVLPRFVRRRYFVPSMNEMSQMPYIEAAVGSNMESILWRSAYGGRDYAGASHSIYESLPVVEPAIEVRSNLSEDLVQIDNGTDVLTSDGLELGVVDELVTDDGHIRQLGVRTGLPGMGQVLVPIEQVSSMTHKQIRLRVSFDDIKRQPEQSRLSAS